MVPFRFRPLLAAAMLSTGIVPALRAQDAPDTTRSARLPELTVSASRPRTVPPPVTTITVPAIKLRTEQAANPYALMRSVTGIEVHEQGQGPGFASDVVLRGFSSDHSSDVLLVIDGVPINLPVHGHVEGYADWSILSPPSVESFRVITGTASPLYGDFAMGGVVEVFTMPDAGGLSAGFSGSSFGDGGGWVRTGHRGGDGGSAVALNVNRQQGWRDNSSYWLGNGLLRGWHRLGARGRIEGGLALYGSDWDSPGFLSVAQYNAGDLTQAIDPTDGGTARRLVAHGRVSGHSGPMSLEASAWLQRVQSTVFLNIPEDGVQQQSDEEDRRWAFGGRAQLGRPLGVGDLSLGVEGRFDDTHYDLYDTAARERIEATKQYDGKYASGGGFARVRQLVAGKLALDLGARLDVLRYDTRDRLVAGDWVANTEAVVGPKLGARWFLTPTLSVLASVSRGFRGAPGVIADPTLPPITAWTKELGLHLQDPSRHLDVSLAAFRLDVSHERIQDPVTREISSAGGSVRQGLTGALDWLLSPRFRVLAEGTLNDANISGEPNTEIQAATDVVPGGVPATFAPPRMLLHLEPLQPGDPVPNVARYTAHVELESVLSHVLVARGAVRFNGPYTPIGERKVRTQAYAVADLGASVHLGSNGTTLDVELRNLFDTKTPEIRASGFINPGEPRTLRASIRLADRP